MQQEIINGIKKRKRWSTFGIFADEVTDVSNWEQLGIIIRYVKDCEPIERLLEFVPCEDIKGKSLCIYLVKALQIPRYVVQKRLMALVICQEKQMGLQEYFQNKIGSSRNCFEINFTR